MQMHPAVMLLLHTADYFTPPQIKCVTFPARTSISAKLGSPSTRPTPPPLAESKHTGPTCHTACCATAHEQQTVFDGIRPARRTGNPMALAEKVQWHWQKRFYQNGLEKREKSIDA
jgi:hypothetical protein